MPNFAIMRSKKLSSMGSVAASLKHCYRERDTPNADPNRTPKNELLIGESTDQVMGALRERLPEKRRKDAVLAVEYVMTASPEWWEKATPAQQAEFFDKSMAWLAGKYGEKNIIAANVQKDELTPHLSAYVVPITTDGRLSAKEFIGNKAKMTLDQTKFALAVKDLGLERGIEGSRATHQRVQAHYAGITQAHEGIPVFTEDELKPQKARGESVMQKLLGAVESPKGVALRLNAKVRESVQPIAEKAATAVQERRRAKDLQETLSNLQKRLQRFEMLFTLGLSKDQIQKVVDFARGLRIENKRQLELEREQRRDRDRGISR